MAVGLHLTREPRLDQIIMMVSVSQLGVIISNPVPQGRLAQKFDEHGQQWSHLAAQHRNSVANHHVAVSVPFSKS